MKMEGIIIIIKYYRWRDDNGCYYDKEGQPSGWFVLHPGNVYHEHFYDSDGFYVPSDIENSDND